MNWEEYKKKFYHYAIYNQKDEEYISNCLDYAENLFKKKLPVIFDQTHLSLLLGVKSEYLYKVTNLPELFYREFKIPKKNKDKFRLISEPLPNLKDIQRWILDNVLYQLQPSEYSKAFRKGKSIKDNAKFHLGQKKVLTIDIENYFGTIKFKEVYKFFYELGYSKQVSIMMSNLCVLEKGLPQGAPTSPMLATLITKNIDIRLAAFAKTEKIRYTRYADDLTFSGDFEEGYIIKFVSEVIKSEGFRINHSKTRVRMQHQRQEVTGIVVNRKLQVSKEKRREFRKTMYFIRKFGLESHMMKNSIKDRKKYLYHLMGIANFIRAVNPHDKTIENEYSYLNLLLQESK